jgi:hypothetical protein
MKIETKLTGSEKQIAWAEQIRESICSKPFTADNVRNELTGSKGDTDMDCDDSTPAAQAWVKARLEAAREALISKRTNAAWWIDTARSFNLLILIDNNIAREAEDIYREGGWAAFENRD